MNPHRITATLLGLCAAVCFSTLLPSSARAADEKPIKALFICGGCCHDYLHQKDIITKGISERANVEWVIAYDTDKGRFHLNSVYDNPDWSKGFDVIVHDECTDAFGTPQPKDPKDPKAGMDLERAKKENDVVNNIILAPHKSGLPAVVLHCGMHCYRGDGYPKTTPWFEFTGLNTNHHGPQIPISINFIDKENPIVQGMENWATMKEELYHQTELLPTAHALAEGSQDDNPSKGKPYKDKATLIWTNTYNGKTKVFGTTLAHNNETNADGRYLDLVTRGLLWAVDKLDDSHFKKIPNTTAWDKPKAGARGPAGDGGVTGPLSAAQPAAHEAPPAQPAPKSTKAPKDAKEAANVQLDDEPKLLGMVKVPQGFEKTIFASPPNVGYPVCLSAAPTGELFVGVDENGSLDKAGNRGRVVRAIDSAGNGKADKFSVFATMDSPRGLVYDNGDLWVLHPPALTVYHDPNNTGKAQSSEDLITGLAHDLSWSRGADHTCNGIQLGIDGWIYIASGDYGALKAVAKDGTAVQLHGGGVYRIRPDGSGFELFAIHTRNICDVTIDPLLNVYLCDNTNDGDAWNERLMHVFNTADFGYPSLFSHFPDEIVQPLNDYGGGSPTGILFVDEPGWPAPYGHALYVCEWGRSQLFRHPLTADGASFARPTPREEFIAVPRPTQINMDGQSRMYIASWKGAVFSYAGPNVGFVARVTHPDAKNLPPFPDLKTQSDEQLAQMIAAPSAVWRLHTQREILRRGDKPAFDGALQKIAADAAARLESRVAAMLTLRLLRGSAADEFLLGLVKDATVREWAIRALADDKKLAATLPAQPFVEALADNSPRVRLQAVIALGRMGKTDTAEAVIPLLLDGDPQVAHASRQTLIRLHGVDACFKALDTGSPSQAPAVGLVLQAFHEQAVVDGLIQRLPKFTDPVVRGAIVRSLSRLYFEEAPYDGGWWSTRPDTSGPYYKTAKWDQSDKILPVLRQLLESAKGEQAEALLLELKRHKIDFPEATPLMLKLAQSDPSFRSKAVDLLVSPSGIPEEAVPFLAEIASDDKTPVDARMKAIHGLQRGSAAPGAFEALVKIFGALGQSENPSQELLIARGEFVRDGNNAGKIGKFAKLAQSPEASSRELAYSVMLMVEKNAKAKDKDKADAAKVIEAAWAKPDTTANLLRAIGQTRYSPMTDKVKAHLNDENADVKAAAQFAGVALHIPGVTKAAGPAQPLIATLQFEDAVASASKETGDAALGAKLFIQQGCVQCHTVSQKEPPKGPCLEDISTRYSKPELFEAILKPSAKIAMGFETHEFTMKDKKQITGFIAREAGEEVDVRDLTGQVTTLQVKDIVKRKNLPTSIMPDGLADNLTPHDLASILAYLNTLKSKPK